MKQHFKKFSSETEYNAYINGNPVLPNVSLIGDSGKVNFLTEYIKQYLTFEILEDGYIGFNDTQSLGLTVQYNKNNTGWTNLTSGPCNLLTEEITVDGKSGTYTYGGFDTNMYKYYWENNDDKLYCFDAYISTGESVSDDASNNYQVLTTKDAPRTITSEITVDGKSGTYTFGGIEEGIGLYCWENNDDKLYYFDTYIVTGESVSDLDGNTRQVLTTKDSLNDNFIQVTEGDTLCFKGDNPTYYRSNFLSTGKFNIKGNIMSLIDSTNFTMSLIDSTNFTTETTLTEEYTFYGLFSNTGIVSAKNLILPATTLASNCYQAMFQNCTSLTTAPELPATTLASNCYQTMFQNCTGLTTAPELPATTLAEKCYRSMFQGCTSLTTVPSDLLPATTLASNCYYQMFRNCTSLTTAPELQATTLTESCYYLMFNNCTSLSSIKCLATNISASGCTSGWVNNVAASGTFVKADSMTDWTEGADGIPSGWTVQDAS